MRVFRQRIPRKIFVILSAFFTVLTVSGIYGYFFSPQDEIEIYHVLVALFFVFLPILYINSKISVYFDEVSKEVRILDDDVEILRAKYSGDIEIAKNRLSSLKIKIDLYEVDHVPGKYRYNVVVVKPNCIIFNMIFLRKE